MSFVYIYIIFVCGHLNWQKSVAQIFKQKYYEITELNYILLLEAPPGTTLSAAAMRYKP